MMPLLSVQVHALTALYQSPAFWRAIPQSGMGNSYMKTFGSITAEQY